MKEFKYVVTDNEGIHARPAGELVKLVKGFESTISIEKEGKKVDLAYKRIHVQNKGIYKQNASVNKYRQRGISLFSTTSCFYG